MVCPTSLSPYKCCTPTRAPSSLICFNKCTRCAASTTKAKSRKSRLWRALPSAFTNFASRFVTLQSTPLHPPLAFTLVFKGIHVTKRDLFYTDVKLFEKQAASDAVLEEMGCTLTLDCMRIVFDFMLLCSRHGRLHALQPQRHGLREGRRRWQAAV
jgi:hypothetical protein